uniref:Uncharacterized protein n=1 Tax=Setaria viridis TaxID=4556 RepID=A0A4U6WBP6_SETVI|nr:hypothetical protein SEVIR_1G180801v2 [Setaria viridis]
MPFSGFALAVLLLSMASHAKPCSDQEKSSLLRFIAELPSQGEETGVRRPDP